MLAPMTAHELCQEKQKQHLCWGQTIGAPSSTKYPAAYLTAYAGINTQQV